MFMKLLAAMSMTDPNNGVSGISDEQQWRHAVVILEVISLRNILLLVHRQVWVRRTQYFVQLKHKAMIRISRG